MTIRPQPVEDPSSDDARTLDGADGEGALRSAFAFLLVVSLAVSANLAVFPQAARAASPSISVTPLKFGSGQTVVVTGTGFASGEMVSVWFDGNGNVLQDPNEPAVVVQADPSGAFTGATFVVKASKGTYFIRAGTPAVAFAAVQLGSCLFQICVVDGHQTVCIVGNAPSDTIADCKVLDSSYTDPPNGYNFGDVGPRFAGAGILAAAVNSLNFLGVPGPGCAAMTGAIIEAESAPYFNAVPGKFDLFKPTQELLNIACGPPYGPVGFIGFDLPSYLTVQTIAGHALDPAMADAAIIGVLVAAAQGSANPVVIGAAQIAFAKAAVAGAIVCGFVDYYCNGSDITANILLKFDLQKQLVPVPFLNTRWGDIIGWAKAVCTDNVMPPLKAGDTGAYEDGSCEKDPAKVAQPGTAGPNNAFSPIRCAIGTINGLSIGYDGDISFDVNDGVIAADGSIDMKRPGPNLMNPGDGQPPLTNYHNFQLGPGGSEPPDGIDIEIPLTDRGRFIPLLVNVRKGLRVKVCGFWVADMHMLWNELHPMTSLAFLPAIPVAKTPPVITPDVSGRLGANGWYTGDVTVNWTVSAPDSPVSASAGCGTTIISTDTGAGGLSLACTATNEGGTSVNGVVIKRDTTPPIISHVVTPPVDGTGGWYVSAPTVTFSCSDAASSVASCTADGQAGPSITLGESAAPQSVAGTVTDNAGNVSHDSASGLLVDLSLPTISAAATTPVNLAGWNNSDVTVHFTCTDNVSGIPALTCPADQLLTTEGSAVSSAARTVADAAGNISHASNVVTVKIDKTAPSVSASATRADGPAYLADTWTNQTVTVHYTCVDAGSGVATCSGDQTVSVEGTTAPTTGTATDNAGNTASVNFGPVKIDKTPPTITFSGNALTYTVDQTISITCVASDALSGIATASCPAVASPATNYAGTTATTSTTLNATATDNAGNAASATTTFSVTVTAVGICRLTASLSTADAICAHATSIATAPNAHAKAGKLDAFDHFLAAQSGKSIPAVLANLLSRLAHLL